VTSRYKGDCRCGFTAVTPLGTNVDKRLRVVNDNSAMADRAGFELNGGASISFFYRKVNDTNPPNKVTIQVRRDNDGTVIRTYQTLAAEPADGTAFTFFATADGTNATAARAGVYRLYLRTVKDDSALNALDYDLDTDGTLTTAVGFVGTASFADSGCLRGNALGSLAVNAYNAGKAKFSYRDNAGAANQVITLTATHTQKLGAPSGETARLDFLNAADAQFIAGTTGIDAGTSHQQTVTVGNNFTLALASYGARWLPTGNAAFVPDSGAILWTKAIANGGGTVQDGNNVKRSSFYDIDPRFTIGVHAEGDDTYTVGGNDTLYVISADQLFAWAADNAGGGVQDANGFVVPGITMTQRLLNGAAVVVTNTAEVTNAAGRTPDPGLDWTTFVSAPAGNRTQEAFPNAPANAVGLGTASQTVSFSSAFTADRALAIRVPDEVKVGDAIIYTIEYLKGDGTRVTLDSAPTARVYYLDSNGVQVDEQPPALATQFAGQQAWFRNWTVSVGAADKVCVIEVRAPFAGAPIEGCEPVTVLSRYFSVGRSAVS